MAKTPKLRLIRDRCRDIENEMERLKGMMAQLETEAAELKIAERVLASLSIDEDDEIGDGVAHIQGAVNGNRHVGGRDPVRKPDGIPTMPEMIMQALENVKSTGRGLEPKQMAEFIDKHWWPGVPTNSVGPIAWRMYKRRELNRRGNRYYLPTPTNQPPEEGP